MNLILGSLIATLFLLTKIVCTQVGLIEVSTRSNKLKHDTCFHKCYLTIQLATWTNYSRACLVYLFSHYVGIKSFLG